MKYPKYVGGRHFRLDFRRMFGAKTQAERDYFYRMLINGGPNEWPGKKAAKADPIFSNVLGANKALKNKLTYKKITNNAIKTWQVMQEKGTTFPSKNQNNYSPYAQRKALFDKMIDEGVPYNKRAKASPLGISPKSPPRPKAKRTHQRPTVKQAVRPQLRPVAKTPITKATPAYQKLQRYGRNNGLRQGAVQGSDNYVRRNADKILKHVECAHRDPARVERRHQQIATWRSSSLKSNHPGLVKRGHANLAKDFAAMQRQMKTRMDSTKKAG